MDGDLDVRYSDDASDDLVQSTVAATGVEACLMAGMVVAPSAGPSGCIAWGTGYVYLIVEIGMV